MATVMAAISTATTVLETIDTVIKMGKEFMKSVTTSDIKMDVIPVHCDLAVSFKGLLKKDVKEMDAKLKVIIAGSTKAIGKLTVVSWKNILSCMNQNSLLKIVEGSNTYRADKLIKKGSNVFDVFGKTDSRIVIEVGNWFKKLISDADVLADTKIDIEMLGQIVATTGASITSFETLFAKKEYIERGVVDIGILRYPNPDMPYFKVYRITLKAWRDTTRILMFGTDSNGISGTYNCLKFEPRERIILRLKPATIVKAVDIAEKMFL